MIRAQRIAAVLAPLAFALAACEARVSPGTPVVGLQQGVSVAVDPAEATIAADETFGFTATVTGTSNTAVTWTVVETGGGAIDAQGLYTAPGSPGTFHVRAISVARPTVAGESTVTVASPVAVAVSIVPRTPSVVTGGTVTFSATVTNATNAAVTWSAPGAGCGTITAAGVYTAPSTARTCSVVATSQADPSRSATATVTVTAPGLAWRPFSADSPWNTPIPPNPELQPDSEALVYEFATSPARDEWDWRVDVNIPEYSIPLYWANAATPTEPVLALLGGEGWNGKPSTLEMPIPEGATPDPALDHHMLVIDKGRALEWGCYEMTYSADRTPAWQAKLCATADLNGTGVRIPYTLPEAPLQAHGARACGYPLVAGLIRMEEIEAGRIDHALVIAYPGIQREHYMYPASTPSAMILDPPNGVPCGGRFQYDPTVDVTTLGLSRSGQIIMRALQEYGAYVGDFSGVLSLYAENSPEARAYWANGVLGRYELTGKIDMLKFRVLKYGEVVSIHDPK